MEPTAAGRRQCQTFTFHSILFFLFKHKKSDFQRVKKQQQLPFTLM
jgi:hypothetical protein